MASLRNESVRAERRRTGLHKRIVARRFGAAYFGAETVTSAGRNTRSAIR
jgi:hypothetical protein